MRRARTVTLQGASAYPDLQGLRDHVVHEALALAGRSPPSPEGEVSDRPAVNFRADLSAAAREE